MINLLWIEPMTRHSCRLLKKTLHSQKLPETHFSHIHTLPMPRLNAIDRDDDTIDIAVFTNSNKMKS